MEPLPSSSNPSAPNVPLPAPVSQSTGIVGWIGRMVIGSAASRETSSVDWKRTKCGLLIQDFSQQATQKIIAQANSNFVAGGKDHIQKALEDLLGQVFITFASKGVQAPSALSDDQLADHFIASLITLVIEEFEANPRLDRKQHFINIANKLLETAFPGKLNDPKLPQGLRNILSGSGLYSWAASFVVDTSQFNWERIVTLFANHLQEMYELLMKPEPIQLAEKQVPGATAFAESVVTTIDAQLKDIATVQLSIPLLNRDSNQFVNAFVFRVLKGNISSESDKAVIEKASLWLKGEMQQGIKAVLATLFEPVGKQSPELRRAEMAQRLLAKADKAIPELLLEQKRIKSMNEALVQEKLKVCQNSSQYSYFHVQLKESLEKLEKTQGGEKEAALHEAKTLLITSASYLLVESLLAKELDLSKLRKLLAPSLPVKATLDQLYTYLGHYILEIANQCAEIGQNGSLAQTSLCAKGGAEITVWIDKFMNRAKASIEAKANAFTLNPTDFQFLDEMLCHVLKPGAISEVSDAKEYLDTLLRQMVTIIVSKAIEKHARPGQSVAQTMSSIVNTVLSDGQKAIIELRQVKKQVAITPELCLAKAQALGITLKESELAPNNLIDTFETIFLTERSRMIFATIIDKDLFNQLLPVFLRSMKLWESTGDYLAHYLKGLYVQSDRLQEVSQSGALALQVPEVKSLVQAGVKKLLDKLNAPIVADSMIDQFMQQVLQGLPLQNLLEKVVPVFCESILAYHLNPKDEKLAERRAADLFLTCMEMSESGFDAISQYESAQNKPLWLATKGYTSASFEAYRKARDIPASHMIEIKDCLLYETATKLIQKILPDDLLKQLLPKELAVFSIDKHLVSLCYDYLKQAYDYSSAMKALAITGVSGEPQMLRGIDQYVQEKLQALSKDSKSAQESWVEKVLQQIYATQDPTKKAMMHQFTANMLYGALGFIFANAKSVPGVDLKTSILHLLAPIATAGQQTFHVLNENKSPQETIVRLKITEAEIRTFLAATGKPIGPKASIDYEALPIRQLAYYVTIKKSLEKLFTNDQWRALLPEFLAPIFTQDVAANFVVPIVEMIHQVQELMQHKGTLGLIAAEKETGLKKYLDDKVVTTLGEVVNDLGLRNEPLSKGIPPLLDMLVKQILTDDKTELGNMRMLIVQRVVYTVLEGLLSNQGDIINKLKHLVASYTKGDHQATATLLVQTAFPKEFFTLPLAKLITDEIAIPEIADCIAEIKQSQDTLQVQALEAKAYLESLEGVPELLTDIFKNLDETLDGMAKSPNEPFADDLPKVLDDQLKIVLKDDTLGPLAKEAIHSVLYLCLNEALSPRLGQSVQDRVLEVAGEMISLTNSPDTEKTGIAWLKLLMPEKTLQALLPPFLRKAVTHEKLVQWFFTPYLKQVFDTQKTVQTEVSQAPSSNVRRLQVFTKDWLEGYTKPSSTKRGLAGYQGVVREIEKSIIDTLDVPESEVGKTIDTYLQAVVGQVTRQLESDGSLSSHYIADSLIASLDAPVRADMPPDAEAFNTQAAQLLLQRMFPKGKDSLIVPDVAKNAVWNRLTKSISTLFAELTQNERRILWSIDRLIESTTDDQALIGKRRQEIEDMRYQLLSGRRDPEFWQKTEKLFKDYTLEAALRRADSEMEKSSLWAPFKWLAKQVVKVTTHLVVRFSVRNRLWNFLSDEKSDGTIRNFMWNFLKVAPNAQEKAHDCLIDDLTPKIDSTLAKTEVLPWLLRGPVSSRFAKHVVGKNLVDLLV